ncbi:Adenylosuccinate synthase [Diatrype stigma]|uniref:RNA exonuclease 4 n=1 Tax=Diatrype stigma TaxID=117547 RepID=A0AAN9V0R0_9PEZI
MMAPELSSNWKILQGRIKAESSASASSSSKSTAQKRKAEGGGGGGGGGAAPSLPKRQKLGKSAAEKPQRQAKKETKPTPRQQRNSKPAAAAAAAGVKMGVTQSSAVTRGTSVTITPSLALWAEDNDISAEDLAEAYNLGVPPPPTNNSSSSKHGDNDNNNPSSFSRTTATAAKVTAVRAEEDRARANEGLAPPDAVASLGRYVAIDCEMVGVGPEGRDSVLARVSLVDFHGRQVYDSLVRPREPVTDWRTAITGLTPRSMRAARAFEVVQREVADLLFGKEGGSKGGSGPRILVGHDVRHDLAVLDIGSYPPAQIRDTARFSGYRQYGHGPKPALRVLAREVLGVEIQAGHHSSLEDARVAMLLFRKRKPEFDVEHAAKYGKMLASRGSGGDGGGGGYGDGAGNSKELSRAKAKAGAKKKKKRRN